MALVTPPAAPRGRRGDPARRGPRPRPPPRPSDTGRLRPERQPAGRGRARRGRGPPPPRTVLSHDPAARRRLRLGEDHRHLLPARRAGLRPHRRRAQRPACARCTAPAGRPTHRRSSTSTWRSTATSTSPSPRSAGCSTRRSSPHSTPGSSSRPTSPTPRRSLADLCAWAGQRHARSAGRSRCALVKGANLAMEQVDAELRGWPPAPYDRQGRGRRQLQGPARPRRSTPTGRRRAGRRRPATTCSTWPGRSSWPRRWRPPPASTSRCSRAWRRPQAEAVRRRAGAPAPLHARRRRRRLRGQHRLPRPPARRERRAGELPRSTCSPSTSGSPEWERQRGPLRGRRRRAPRVWTTGPGGTRTARPEHRRSTPTRRSPTSPTPTSPAPPTGRGSPSTWLGRRPMAGRQLAASSPTVDQAAVDRTVAAWPRRRRRWAARPEAERRRVLHRVAEVLAARRGEAIAVMAHETGKTVAEGDPEVSEAIDFARWYAGSGTASSTTSRPTALAVRPARRRLVAAPWNFPTAIPADGVLAALAAGNGRHPQAGAARPWPYGRVLADCLHEAGVPPTSSLLPVPDDDVGRHLVTHPDVDAVVLTGSYDTARLFLGWDPTLPAARRDERQERPGRSRRRPTSTPPSRDLVRSAFGHAGQKCSAASLAIVEALGVRRPPVPAAGWPTPCAACASARPPTRPPMVGPLIGPPAGPLARALHAARRRRGVAGRAPSRSTTTADAVAARRAHRRAARLVVPPHRVLRAGARRRCGPTTSTTPSRCRTPSPSGSPAGCTASTRPRSTWLDRVEVGNAYVNRHTTGAIVRRQPFGGWKRSASVRRPRPAAPTTCSPSGVGPLEDLCPSARVYLTSQQSSYN